MKAPDKGSGSVEGRVKAVINKLSSDQLIVSPRCKKTIEMFNMLKRDTDRLKNEELYKPKKTGAGHIHIFDALSYPIYYYDLLMKGNSVRHERTKPNLMIKSFRG
jgi:phage terminase large subunit